MTSAADDQRALVAASCAVFVWGFGPLLVRGVDASAGAIVFWRFLLAQPVMIAACYLGGGRITWPLIKRVLVPAVLFAGSMGASFLSFQKTSIVNASLIGALQPALLLIAAPIIFSVASSGRQIGFAIVAFGGITAVVLGAGATSGASISGDLWAVVNLLLWTVYFVMVKRIRDDGVNAGALIAAIFLVAGFVAAPVTLVASDDVMSVGAKGFALLAVMAIGPGLLGHGMMTWSQKHLDIRIASLLGLASPVVSTIGAWIIYSQELRSVQILGGLLVLAGLAGIVWDHRMTRAGALELEPA